MKKVIDGITKDWGERLYYLPVKGGKSKNVRSGGGITAPAKASGPATREKIARTVNKTPEEVMVNISDGGKNMQHIKVFPKFRPCTGSFFGSE